MFQIHEVLMFKMNLFTFQGYKNGIKDNEGLKDSKLFF